MIGTMSRVLTGFLLACLTAGLVTVLYVFPPSQMAALPANVFNERAGQAGILALLAATHSAIFGAAFTLIAAVIGEWLSIRNVVYYLLAGTAIALLGFLAQFSSEVTGQPTILNNYALMAFLTAGFFAGVAYWLAAGQFAGGRRTLSRPDFTTRPRIFSKNPFNKDAFSKAWKRPRIVVEDAPEDDKKASSLSERIDSERIENAEAKVRIRSSARPNPSPSAAAATSVPTTKAPSEPRPNPVAKPDSPKTKSPDSDEA